MKIRHRYLTQATFNALGSKDPGTLYHIEDTQAIYRGATPIVISSDKINTGSGAQTKAGSLTIQGTLTLSNALGITSGGTGKNSIASGSMLYASASNTLTELVTSSFGRSLLNASSGSVVTGLNADTLDGNHASAFALIGHTHSYATPAQLTDGSVTRLGTATVGATNRPIYLNAGTPTAASVGEAFLTWGGQNHNGSYAPIDAAMVPLLGANRSAFIPASLVTVEYSRDGGTTWIDYGASDSEKIGFFTNFGANFKIGLADTNNPATADYKLRVTLKTNGGNLYSVLNKFVLYISSSGSNGNTCTIDARLESNRVSSIDTWQTFANNVAISGWSGYNVINTTGLTTYGNVPTTHYGEVRFTFGCTGGATSQYTGMVVYGIQCFGGVGWATSSNLGRYGTIYRYDTSQNVYFPANVQAYSFTENGIALSSKYAAIGQTMYIGTTPVSINRSSGNLVLAGVTINGNAGTATKLQTSRTIFGQSFDGTGNVSGSITGATDISLSGTLYVRSSANTYRDTNTGSDSAPMPWVASGYSGKYQAIDGGTVSQSYNFIQENTSGNRIRFATINAHMTVTTAGAEKGSMKFYTKTAAAGIVQAMEINDLQQVLIGTTTNPGSYRHVVSGAGYYSSNLSVMGSLTVAGSITASAFYQS